MPTSQNRDMGDFYELPNQTSITLGSLRTRFPHLLPFFHIFNRYLSINDTLGYKFLEYDRIMKERDYLRKRQELQLDYKKKIEALETVWKLFNPELPLPYEADIEDEIAQPGSSPWTFEIPKKRAVQQAAQALDAEFSTDDVRKALVTMNPAWSAGISDGQLSSIVAKAASDGKLEIVKPKSGRSQAIYKNPEFMTEEETAGMTLDT